MLLITWYLLSMKLVLSLLLPQLSGFIGTFFTIPSIPTWYSTLNKPSFSPPNYLFGPVWLTLYLLMGISVYLIWTSKNKLSQDNVKLFFIHLFFNAIWSPIFFGAKNLSLALYIIFIIWLMIISMIVSFSRVNKISSLLLIPYLLWVSFATVLNFYLLVLN